jgi:hypothetical protein
MKKKITFDKPNSINRSLGFKSFYSKVCSWDVWMGLGKSHLVAALSIVWKSVCRHYHTPVYGPFFIPSNPANISIHPLWQRKIIVKVLPSFHWREKKNNIVSCLEIYQESLGDKIKSESNQNFEQRDEPDCRAWAPRALMDLWGEMMDVEDFRPMGPAQSPSFQEGCPTASPPKAFSADSLILGCFSGGASTVMSVTRTKELWTCVCFK